MITTTLRRRHQLPNFYKLPHVKIDVEKLLSCFTNFNHKQDSISESFGSPYLNEKYKQAPVTGVRGQLKYLKNGNEDERCYGEVLPEYKGTYVEEVINMFKSPVTRSRLIVKQSGAMILPHIDYDTTYSVRYYIPLKTNPWAFTAVKNKNQNEPEVKNLKADGSVWFVNPGCLHSAWNAGGTDDIRFILCVNGQDDLNEASI